MSIWIDTSEWPIVRHITEGSATDAEIDAYIQEASDLLRRSEPHGVIMDVRSLTQATPYARQRKKVWLAENVELLRRTCVCTALILTSPIARFAAATVMLVHPFPTPYRIFGTEQEALAWVRVQLRAKGLTLPEKPDAPDAPPSED